MSSRTPKHPEAYDPHSYEAQGDLHAEPGHHHYADPHEDEAHHVYDDADVYVAADHHDHPDQHFEPGHPLMGAGSSVAVVPAKSKKVRRRRRILALVLTLALFVAAIVVVAQFIKPLLGGDTVADYPGPGTGEVNGSPGAGPKSVATELQAKKVVANADSFLKEFAASGGALAPGEFSSVTK